MLLSVPPEVKHFLYLYVNREILPAVDLLDVTSYRRVVCVAQ